MKKCFHLFSFTVVPNLANGWWLFVCVDLLMVVIRYNQTPPKVVGVRLRTSFNLDLLFDGERVYA